MARQISGCTGRSYDLTVNEEYEAGVGFEIVDETERSTLTRLIVGALLILVGLISLVMPTSAGHDANTAAIVFCSAGLVVGAWGALARRQGGATQVRSWSIRGAARDLQLGAIGAAQQVQYLLAFLILELFSWGVDTEIFEFSWDDVKTYSTPIGVGIIAVKLLGPYAVYWANGGRDGRDFLNRFITLSLPIRIRCIGLLLVLWVPARVLAAFVRGFQGVVSGDVFAGVGVGLFWLAFNLAHYAWLARALTSLRRSIAEGSTATGGGSGEGRGGAGREGGEPPRNQGLLDWLRACPEKGYFVPIESESTDTL